MLTCDFNIIIRLESLLGESGHRRILDSYIRSSVGRVRYKVVRIVVLIDIAEHDKTGNGVGRNSDLEFIACGRYGFSCDICLSVLVTAHENDFLGVIEVITLDCDDVTRESLCRRE